jgi:hypothetical protein
METALITAYIKRAAPALQERSSACTHQTAQRVNDFCQRA